MSILLIFAQLMQLNCGLAHFVSRPFNYVLFSKSCSNVLGVCRFSSSTRYKVSHGVYLGIKLCPISGLQHVFVLCFINFDGWQASEAHQLIQAGAEGEYVNLREVRKTVK